MSSKVTCSVETPKADNGKPSKLYNGLMDSLKQRPIVNWIYAKYLADDNKVGKSMDEVIDPTTNKPKYRRNRQNQHRVEDVMEYMEIPAMLAEMNTLPQEEQRFGFVDINGKRTKFDDAVEAFKKADEFNDYHKGLHNGLVANVYKPGDKYTIHVHKKDTETHMYPVQIKRRLQQWDTMKSLFNGLGIDIENNVPDIVKTIINPYNTDMLPTIKYIGSTKLTNISETHAAVAFFLNQNSPLYQQLINTFGSIEEAAHIVGEINAQRATGMDSRKITLLRNAVNSSIRNVQRLNVEDIEKQVGIVAEQVESPEEQINREIHKLKKKYNIGINDYHIYSQKINTLSDAANQAVLSLERQIRELEKKRGDTEEGKRLSAIKEQLLNEIYNKRYYAGLANYLKEVSAQLNYDPHTGMSIIQKLRQQLPEVNTGLDNSLEGIRILQSIRKIYNQYYTLVEALSDSHLKIDESIGEREIADIKKSAGELYELLKDNLHIIQDLSESYMVSLLTAILGDTAANGLTIENLVKMFQKESSWMDRLYSMGRSSNPMVAAMGKLIGDAQASRNSALANIGLRIRRATERLHGDSKFMYADDGHLISDIDWGKYNDARKKAIKELKSRGLRDWDLIKEIRDWEERNTEDRVVDKTTGRTERVPNQNYRNNLATWDSVSNKLIFKDGVLTEAQQEYYDTMMQIKGEVGTLLPEYARHQYLPPQLRRNMLDALEEASSVKDVIKALKNKLQNFYKIREDDTEFNKNGQIKRQTIDGEDYSLVESNYDNTPLREIPIFFVNEVEQGELLKDFSTGLQALAATAINYDVMSDVLDAAEFMADFIKNQESKDNMPKADQVNNRIISLTYDLNRWGKQNGATSEIVDTFMAQHFFGQTLDPNQMGYEYAKAAKNLIGYTSFRGLATNFPGMLANFLVGEFQMLIEAGAGEFYGFQDYLWAQTKLFGNSGVMGEMSELLTNNMSHKAPLMRELFDPMREYFSDMGHKRYYHSMFRQLMSHDCSFIGYGAGEYLIHYVNMYAVLHRTKVKLNGKIINLYDAYEVTNNIDKNAELKLKDGVTTLDGKPITKEWIDKVKNRIKYANESCHGAMNAENKGIIHQKLLGRLVMNFRQWMVEHYSRRFRSRHFDYALGEYREGYWISAWQYFFNEDTVEEWKEGSKKDAVMMFIKDLMTFAFRAQSQWHNLNEMQRYNVKRVHTEMCIYLSLLGLSFALGEPDEHKKEFWKRWWIYQTKRLLLEFESVMPITIHGPYDMVKSNITIFQSPMAGVNTLNSLLYVLGGMFNGDIMDEIKRGPHKGEKRYWRNIKKYFLPFFKDFEKLQRLSEDESIFQVFKDTPSNY